MTEFRTNLLLGKLGLLYGSPSKDAAEAQAIVSEYARLMNKYSDSELEAAGDKIARTRKFKSWPTIGDCIAALEDYRAEAYEKNAPERKTAIPHPEWSKARIAEADRMIQCEMGEKAAREGWVLSLHDFCREKQRMPKQSEIPALMDAARYVDRCAAGIGMENPVPVMPYQALGRRDDPVEMIGPLNQMLVRMAHTFIDKREKLAKQVLGEAA